LPQENFGYEKWKEATLLFELLSANNATQVSLVSYRGFMVDADSEIRRVFRCLDLSTAAQTLKFINSFGGGKNGTYSVYNSKPEDHDWQGSLPSSIVEEVIDDVSNSGLKKYLSV
jgi:hypothetical protein